MRCNNLYIAGTGMSLAPRVSVADAIAAGYYDTERAAKTKQREVAVAPDDARAVDYAVDAAQMALARSGHLPPEIAILLHGVVLHAGLDAWNVGSYLQGQLGITNPGCLVAETRSGCDGLAGVQLAAAYLTALPDAAAALVTAADIWPAPTFDRWSNEGGLIYGDGAAALVLSKKQGVARLLGMATVTEPALEPLHRGNEPFGPFRHNPDVPLDMGRRHQEYFRTASFDRTNELRDVALHAVVEQALADSDVELLDIRHVVVQFYGERLLYQQHLNRLGMPVEKTVADLGRTVGHMGAPDVLAGVHHLHASGRAAPGDLTLVLGEGAGYICTALVLESLA